MGEPLYHAKWIKLWADGANIQYKTGAGNWVDVISFNSMAAHDIEYRVKPGANEPWKPKDEENYFFINASGQVDTDNWFYNNAIDENRFDFGNCFRTKKEAEAAAERVKDALKGVLKISAPDAENFQLDGKDAETKALKEELETLQIRCENLHKAKEQLIASHVSVDDVTLTGGEVALIRALRGVKICRVPEYLTSVLCFVSDSRKHTLSSPTPIAFLTESNISEDKAVVAAIKQIKQEQEANREA